jgi:hypothetical protein
MAKKFRKAFLERMQEEKMASQKRRGDFTIRKFIFIGALFSVGVAKLPEQQINLTWVLYIVPFISLCFDLYILGEDYGIKRMGGFVKLKYKGTMDSAWEEWVAKRRDPFAIFAVPLLSIIILVSCAAILRKTEACNSWFWIWFWLLLGGTVFLYIYSRFLRKKLLKNEKTK